MKLRNSTMKKLCLLLLFVLCLNEVCSLPNRRWHEREREMEREERREDRRREERLDERLDEDRRREERLDERIGEDRRRERFDERRDRFRRSDIRKREGGFDERREENRRREEERIDERREENRRREERIDERRDRGRRLDIRKREEERSDERQDGDRRIHRPNFQHRPRPGDGFGGRSREDHLVSRLHAIQDALQKLPTLLLQRGNESSLMPKRPDFDRRPGRPGNPERPKFGKPVTPEQEMSDDLPEKPRNPERPRIERPITKEPGKMEEPPRKNLGSKSTDTGKVRSTTVSAKSSTIDDEWDLESITPINLNANDTIYKSIIGAPSLCKEGTFSVQGKCREAV